MNVFLLRHGACEDAAGGMDDSQRRLTPEGEKAVADSLSGMKQLIGRVDFILSSPYVRAMQTAGIVAEAFKCKEFLYALPELAGRGNDKKITSELNRLIGKENVVVVGHMPHLAELARYLVGETYEGEIKLKKGGMAKIYIQGFPEINSGMMRWIMTSEELKTSGERHSMQ